MAPDVACVGLTILDILGRPVERVPEAGGVAFIDEIRLTVAGTAAGTAIDCAKLGLQVLVAGAVGEDEKGDFILDVYRRHGIDCTTMRRIPGAPTSATILNIRPNGERPALHQRGASDHMWVDEADRDTICCARFVHMGGSGLLARMDGAPTAALLRAAKTRGCVTTFDLIAPGPDALGIVAPCLPHIDYFMPSLEEAAALSGRAAAEDAAAFFLDRGAGACIVKCGADGSLFAGPDGVFRIPAFAVEVVDTTGCGDAYCAGFIAGLARGWDADRACRLGSAAGALVATGLGSDAGIRNFDATAAFMETAPILA